MIILNKEELDLLIRKLKGDFQQEVIGRQDSRKEVFIYNSAIEQLKAKLLEYDERE